EGAGGAGGTIEADLRALPEALGADLLPLEIHLEATSERARTPKSLLLATLGVHAYLGTLPDTRLSLSAATLIDEWTRSDPRALEVMARAEHDGTAKERTRALIEDPRVAQWVRADQGFARLEVLFARTSYARREELLAYVTHYVDKVYPEYRVR